MNRQQQQEQISLKQYKKYQIGHVTNAPQFMAFNPHIKSGYRINFTDPFSILKSLFIFHNQTINIWTHLIGSLIIFSVIISFFTFVDKAQAQYQLKKYQSNLNKGFNQLDGVLKRIETTLKDFQNAQNSLTQENTKNKDLSTKNQKNSNIINKFQYELKQQYKIVTDLVKKQIQATNIILKYDIQLTQEQKRLRKQIKDLLSDFQTIEREFQKQIISILWENLNLNIFQKNHHIQTTRNKLQKLQNQINSKVIQYLQLQKQTPNPYGVPRWPILIFLISVTLCLGFSAIFHLFLSMSSDSFKYFRRLDYAGVLLNIVGTGISPIYYSLYCNPFISTIYLTVMTIFGSIIFVTLIGNWVHKEENRKYKPMMFGGFGVAYLIPFSHFLINQTFFNNFGDPFTFSNSAFWWFLCGFSYLSGLYIYSKKWPEVNYKQKFDLIGSSHQIWHLLCLVGVVASYIGVNINYQTRKQCPCP